VDPFPVSPKNIAWFQGKLKIKGKKVEGFESNRQKLRYRHKKN
jgi:hypothetical protein